MSICAAITIASTQWAAGKDTTRGKAVALYAPRPQLPEVARVKRLAGSGVFLSHVRPDGTVSRVDVFRSTGHRVLDTAVVAAFSKWRFKPGTMSEIRTPVNFTGNYTPPR
jgi:TonB family protein